MLGVGHTPLCNRRIYDFFNYFYDIRNMVIESILYYGIHRYTKVYYEHDNH